MSDFAQSGLISTLQRLNDTIVRRQSFVFDVIERLVEQVKVCLPYTYSASDSPFFCPIVVDGDAITSSKIEFAERSERRGLTSIHIINM